MSTPNELAVKRAAVARAHRKTLRDASAAHEETEARRELAAAKLEDYIRRTVEAAPPLTTEQRDRLASLLSRSSRGDAA